MSLEKPSKDSSAGSSPADFFRKRPASERRIKANRKNALRSTGPKTERGKRTVARNAIKHGLLARQVVITAGDGKESSEEFHALVGQLCDDYEPVGVVEEMLVQTIATCWWRKARVIRAENGEICKGLDTLAVDRAQRNSDKGNRDLALLTTTWWLHELEAAPAGLCSDGVSAVREGQRDLYKSHVGLLSLTTLLQAAKSEMASEGYLSEEIRSQIVWMFSQWDFCFAFACLLSPERKKEERPSAIVEDEEVVDEQTDKRNLIAAAIDNQLERIRTLNLHATVRENLVVDAEARSFSLPPADATDKLLRYEAQLDRQLYRAMDQLERLQRQAAEKTCRLLLTLILEEGDSNFAKQSQEVLCFQIVDGSKAPPFRRRQLLPEDRWFRDPVSVLGSQFSEKPAPPLNRTQNWGTGN